MTSLFEFECHWKLINHGSFLSDIDSGPKSDHCLALSVTARFEFCSNKTQCHPCKRLDEPIVSPSWFLKGFHLWIWSLGCSQQPFLCVLSHFGMVTTNWQPGDPSASWHQASEEAVFCNCWICQSCCTCISLSCYMDLSNWCMDFSKLLHWFVKIYTWLSLSCNMNFSKLLHGFFRVVT